MDAGAYDDVLAAEMLRDLPPEVVAGVLAAVHPLRGVERRVDLALRTGPYGDQFGTVVDGLGLDRLRATPSGVDLGPLAPRVPEMLRTPSGRIELAPPSFVDALAAAAADLTAPVPDCVIVGRRHLRSNNSWMHNLPLLAKGPERCTLLIHPEDAAALGLANGQPVRLRQLIGYVGQSGQASRPHLHLGVRVGSKLVDPSRHKSPREAPLPESKRAAFAQLVAESSELLAHIGEPAAGWVVQGALPERIALLGNPNCGKTTLFNALTGSRQKVGNWPGVTVEKKTGTMMLDGQPATLVDLPGTYSLRLRVTDNGSPAQSAEQIISVQVNDDIAPTTRCVTWCARSSWSARPSSSRSSPAGIPSQRER